MALKKIGYYPCPYCDNSASVGITKDGDGNAVYVTCVPDLLHIQVSRWNRIGQGFLRDATPEPRHRPSGPSASKNLDHFPLKGLTP